MWKKQSKEKQLSRNFKLKQSDHIKEKLFSSFLFKKKKWLKNNLQLSTFLSKTLKILLFCFFFNRFYLFAGFLRNFNLVN